MAMSVFTPWSACHQAYLFHSQVMHVYIHKDEQQLRQKIFNIYHWLSHDLIHRWADSMESAYTPRPPTDPLHNTHLVHKLWLLRG